MKAVVALGLALTVAVGGSRGGPRLQVAVAGGVVSPGDRVVVRVTGAPAERRLRLSLLRYPLTTATPVAIGTVVPDRRGRAQLAFSLPELAAAVYVPAACCSHGRRVIGHGLLTVPAVAPAGFGPLGGPGCDPASPRSRDRTAPFAQSEIFGTGVGAQLWVLAGSTGPSLSDDATATLDGVVGKQEKIIFRMTSGVPTTFYAVAPDGTRVPPAWGPDPHASSNWNRPGAEWGAGFVFTEPGCWQIHAASPPADGDLWLSIRS